MEIRTPVAPWEDLDRDQQLALLRELLSSEGFLYLIYKARQEKAQTLALLAIPTNERDKDLWLKGYATGVEFCEGILESTLSKLRSEAKEEVNAG